MNLFLTIGIMIILGIDPGTRITGYGIIDSQFQVLDYGCIRPPPKDKLENRYLIIYESIISLIDQYHPEAIVTETQFVKHNVQSAMKLGMARAMPMLAAAKNKIPFFEYAPTRAKKAVVGRGLATKDQVQKMVMTLLSLEKLPEPEDAADALALALAHANTIKDRSCLNTFKER